jgi:hypothetical protein
VLQANRRQLLADNPGITAASVGLGFGRAWTGRNRRPAEIVPVRDYALLLHVTSAAKCPRGRRLPELSIDGVPIFYTVG